MQKASKVIGRGLYFIFKATIGFLVSYLLLFSVGGLIATGDLKSDGELFIFVKTNGVHTDLCLPAETAFFDWKSFLPIMDYPNNQQFQYISIGWGDKEFFLNTPEWSDLTFSTAFNAVFLNSGTAMHATYHESAPKTSEKCAKVYIDQNQYAVLIDYIKNSFHLKEGTVDLIPNSGYWQNDNFYEANGNYHPFKTCNSWTNDALKLAGVKTGLYALSSDGVMRHLK